jgi:hypothetical protein
VERLQRALTNLIGIQSAEQLDQRVEPPPFFARFSPILSHIHFLPVLPRFLREGIYQH